MSRRTQPLPGVGDPAEEAATSPAAADAAGPPCVARLSVHLAGDAVWHHRPAYAEIVHRAHAAGLAGASVFHGVLGYGHHMRIHEERPLHMLTHGPSAVEIVDEEQRLRAFLDTLADVLTMTGVAVLRRVELPGRNG